MINSSILKILTGKNISEILFEKEDEVIQSIKDAYISHEQEDSSLPHSVFLRFPNMLRDRIIGLPAYIAGRAGIKWIASFPENIEKKIDRASATIILNSMDTGRPYCILEGSIISAKRTAASAVLAVKTLVGDDLGIEDISLVGCGLINFEILRFISSQFKNIKNIYIFDIDTENANKFKEKTHSISKANVHVCDTFEEVGKSSKIISFATTASIPYVQDSTIFRHDAIILHISLRDLGENIIKENINIVDDIEHVNREKTSVHLTSHKFGTEDFIYGTLAEVLLGTKRIPTGRVIFSPFGLGILDIQLAHLVYEQSLLDRRGVDIENFIPENWRQND